MAKIEVTRTWNTPVDTSGFFHVLQAGATGLELSIDGGATVAIRIAAQDVVTVPPGLTYNLRSVGKSAVVWRTTAVENPEGASQAQAWAESATPPDPEDATSKSAKTWAGLAETAETNAQGHEAGAEQARTDVDEILTQAQALIAQAGVYEDTAAGLSATSDGGYFTIPSASDDGYLDLYQNDSDTTAVYIDTHPNTLRIAQPAWTGRRHGWPDPFFQNCFPGVDFLGRTRWYGDAGAQWTRVPSTLFDGYALQTSDNKTALTGEWIWFDDFGVETGDTVTLYVLITGTGVTARVAGVQINDAGGNVGSQVTGLGDDDVTSDFVTSSTGQRVKLQFTAASGATGFRLYPYVNTGVGTMVTEALWVGKGTDVHPWPVVPGDAFAAAASATIPDLTERIAIEEQVSEYAFQITETVDGSAKSTTLAVTNALLNQTYGATFQGWGEDYTPAGVSFNAVRVKALGRNESQVDEEFRWQEIHVTVRTGATPSQSGSALVAVGSAKVLPGQAALQDLEILLRDPTSGAVKTLTDADFSGGKYFIGLYARRSDGTKAYMSAHRGEMSNTDSQSYYITTADPDAGSWVPFTSNWRLGVDHVLVSDPETVLTYSPSDGLAADILGDLAGVADYAFTTFETVEASAESVTLAATNTHVGFARNLPFSGWGEVYTPAGVSFNAIRADYLTRDPAVADSGKWDYIKAVVRTGATPHAIGSTLIAIGETRVNRELDNLTFVTIILRDPVTGAVKTLTNSDFSGGKYFIGLYARTESGAFAALSEHDGELSNSDGQSYYITTGDPWSDSWQTNAGNIRLGVHHLLLTDPVEVKQYAPSNQLRVDLDADESLANMPAWSPPTFYVTEGRETSIYFDNLIAGDYQDFHWGVAGYPRGVHQDERWMFNLTSALVIDQAGATISVYPKQGQTAFNTLTIDFEASLASAGTGATPSALFIGDSLINAGVITQTLLDIASGDAMGISLIGTRGTGPNRHEGRGGFTIDDYATEGRTYYEFTVSGVTVEPAINSTEYSHNGAVYRVQEVDLTAGAGTITCSVVSGGVPLASGTLTKTFGSGDATITFSSSAAVSGNPFWIGGAVDFGQWLTDNSFSAPDWVFINLGTNDAFHQTTDAGVSALAISEFAKLDDLLDSIKAADASVKIALMPPPPPSGSQDAFGANYGTVYRAWRAKRNYTLWNAALVEEYGGRTAERIYICPASLNWDTVNNASKAASAPVNSRSSVNVERLNNGVHPATEGYQQIGDAVWAFLKCQA